MASAASRTQRRKARPPSFTYDPRRPTPAKGGALLFIGAGYQDCQEIDARDDVAVFTGPVLADPIVIAGTVVVELQHSCDGQAYDVFVRLSEVDAKGRAIHVCDRFVRVDRAAASPMRIELESTAYRFAQGSRIRISIAGGAHPVYARPLGRRRIRAGRRSPRPADPHDQSRCGPTVDRGAAYRGVGGVELIRRAASVVVAIAALTLSVGAIAVPQAPAATAATTTVTRTGYFTTSDGVKLKYTLKLPAGSGPFPVVVTGDGYDSGFTGGSSIVGGADELVAHGYAALGYNVRGTGCSTGTFAMFPRQWGKDGAEVIEWAARQPWSTGNIAQLGHSFAAFNAWGIGAERPPHLRAMALAVSTGSFYRDAVFPGGIYNAVLAQAFGAGQQANALPGVLNAIAGGDLQCAANFAGSGAVSTPHTVAVTSLTHPYNDDYWQGNAREQYFDQVDVPLLVANPWQDGIAGSGIFGKQLTQVADPDKLWFVGSNGDHDLFDVENATLFRFFDHYLKGSANDWQAEPHIRLWQDSSLPTGSNRVRPGWEIDIPSWPLPVQPHELFLRAGHGLSDAAPTDAEAADAYAYPRLAASALTANNSLDQATWKLPFDTAGAQVWTTAPLTHDVVVAGPASLDFWLASTAPGHGRAGDAHRGAPGRTGGLPAARLAPDVSPHDRCGGVDTVGARGTGCQGRQPALVPGSRRSPGCASSRSATRCGRARGCA